MIRKDFIMKENKYSPYATYGLDKVNSPKPKQKGEPKSTKTTGKGDLRCKKTK